MRKNRLLLLLVLLMTAATGAWAQAVTYPKYLVIDVATGNHRYTDDGPDLTKDLCRKGELWLRYIPAGTFKMGSPTTEPGYVGCENQHWVKLTQPFYIGVFECTQFQWKAIMGTRPSWFNVADWETRPVERVSYEMIRGGNKGTGWPDNDNVDDNSFMDILRTKTGMKFDLPTESQWEYACRAGTTTALNSDVDLTNADEDNAVKVVGRYRYNSGYIDNCEDDPAISVWDLSKGTAKVGTYAKNAWDLYDMHGNVLEWCLDWNYSNDYPDGSEQNPVVDPVGESYVSYFGDSRAMRGGDWISPASGCRSAYRGATQYDAAEAYCGFRIVCLTMPDPDQQHTLTVSGGTAGKTSAYAGETVTITAASPATGQVFDKWTSSDGVTFANATSATTTFKMLDKNVTVTATYRGADVPIYTVSLNDGTMNPTTWTGKVGDATTFSALPIEGVKEGESVTLKYTPSATGGREVKSITATVFAWAFDEYNEGSWDETNKKVVFTKKKATRTPTVVANSDDAVTWIDGWYTVFGNVTINGKVTLRTDTHLILCDGATLTINGQLDYSTHSKNLFVYGQSKGDGKLNVSPNTNINAINGPGASNNFIEFHGGEITATTTGSGNRAIDSGSTGIKVYGGKVKARSDDTAIAFGSGNFIVYGGEVDATSNAESTRKLFGIQGNTDSSTLTVYGGKVKGTGNGYPGTGFNCIVQSGTDAIKFYFSDDGSTWNSGTGYATATAAPDKRYAKAE